MKLNRTLWLFLCLLAVAPAAAQVGTWTAHTSMRQVTGVAASPDRIWAGTTGGLFSVDPASGEIRTYTVVEGLHDIGVTAVAFDAGCGEEGCLWIGYGDGAIDRLDVASDVVRTLWDIQRADRYPVRRINRLQLIGDVLYAATSFGLVVLDRARMEARDTYDRFGSFRAGTAVSDVHVVSDSIFVATSLGLARASLSAPNLRDPASWQTEVPPLPEVLALGSRGGTIYVALRGELDRRTAAGAYERVANAAGAVVQVLPAGERLLAIDQTGVIVVEADGSVRRTATGRTAQTAIALNGSAAWIGDLEEGLFRYPAALPGPGTAAEAQFIPPGPYHMLFEDLVVSDQGDLWAGGVYGAGTGFHRLSASGEWTDFVAAVYPQLEGKDSFIRVAISGTGDTWAGSFGRGLAHVAPDGTLSLYDDDNATFESRAGFVTSPAVDAQGNVWVTNRGATYPLHVRTADGAWQAFPVHTCDGLGSAYGTYDRIYIDSYGQKWITVASRNNFRIIIGLLVLDTGASVTDASDDRCRYLSTQGSGGQGLPSVSVSGVAESPDGTMWIGTSDGPAYVMNMPVLGQDRTWQPAWPVFEGEGAGYALEGLLINDMAVNPGGGIWFGTNQGAWLLEGEAGTYRVAAHHTADDSPLFSDVVTSVTVDPQTGRVYFATDRGLISLAGVSVRAPGEKRDLFIFPNPVRPGADEVFIEGLVQETEVRVVTIDGRLVRRFEASGGRVRWDLRDEKGQPVTSGMYLVVAVGRDGEGAAYGKLAVIR